MPVVDYANRTIKIKIVYYGPGLCGKTTNLEYINHSSKDHGRSGELVSLATDEDRTIFFDFMPFNVGQIRGFNVQSSLYTVPGQVIHNATRKIVLMGVDGVVFVADSTPGRMPDNIESLNNLKENLKAQGQDILTMPYVLQLNKRDILGATPADSMIGQLRVKDEPVFESIAVEGEEVFNTLKGIFRQVMTKLRE